MSSLYQEIQHISDHADKCINYPIGEKLLSALREDDRDAPNFALYGVLIYAASKIFGRKVDFLQQEILGVAKNFEKIDAVTTAEGDEEQREKSKDQKEAKKSRTKKYIIKDGVNIEKTLFEEVEIKIVAKNDINKLLSMPSRLSRLQKMKEFFVKNKARSGKLAIPKSMILNDNSLVSNFGSTLIHDYDDHKDIVGSRKDFTSFSYYINGFTGELESDLKFSSKHKNGPSDNFFLSEPTILDENLIRTDKTIADDFMSIHNDEIQEFISPLTTPTTLSPQNCEKDLTDELNISIDEGIDIDRLSEHNHLLTPIHPVIKLNDILRQSPNLFPEMMQINEVIDMTFSRSILTVMEKIKETQDFTLPNKFKTDIMETRMKNLFMVPLKKLKHRCIFDLPPDEEFRELKRRKIEQFKPQSQAQEASNKRMFKFMEMLNNNMMDSSIAELHENENAPFLGFTKDEQNESLFYIENFRKITNESTNHFQQSPVSTTIDVTIENNSIENSTQITLRKGSNDSGFDSECVNSTSEESSINRDSSETCRLDSSGEIINCSSNNIKDISGADSCIGSSLVSGNSGVDDKNASLPSFFEEFNVKNSTANDENTLDLSQETQSMLESEERVKLMRQSAINVAKWKEYLKPILAESEKRSKIDMHEFGLTVIKKIGNINDTKTFNEVVDEGKTPAYFLTMLQLTNNRNIELNFGKRDISQPTSLDAIKLTLKSKVVHREKFEEMGQQFQQLEENKKLVTLKRKAESGKTSTPAKRFSIVHNDSTNVNSPNQSAINNSNNSFNIQLSQASSGYFSQNSTFSDFE